MAFVRAPPTFVSQLKRRRKARMRLKALFRLVMANRFWLEEIDDYRLGYNYRRNIATIIRRKRQKGILTITEKALINKPHWERTTKERKMLVSILCKLKCFARFSPKVRARLAPYVKYLYYNPGRIITREGDEAYGIYFIVDGEIMVSKLMWNYVRKMYVDVDIAVLGSGDIFGEFALINNSRRPVTTISACDVELLVIYSDEFNMTLKQEMKVMWDHKKEAMASIKYFQNFDVSQMYMACKLSTINQYSPLKTIYSEDNGILDPVFFVISGQCTILQCLKLKVKYINGRKVYSLLEKGKEGKEEKMERTTSGLSLYSLFSQRKYQIEEKERIKKEQEEKEVKEMVEREDRKLLNSDEDDDASDSNEMVSKDASKVSRVRIKHDWRKVDYCGVEIPLIKIASDISSTEESFAESKGSMTMEKSLLEKLDKFKRKGGSNSSKVSDIRPSAESFPNEFELENKSSSVDNKLDGSMVMTESVIVQDDPSEFKMEMSLDRKKIRSIMKSRSVMREDDEKLSIKIRPEPIIKHSPKETKKLDEDMNIETHFVDVGTMTTGAIFGLGERMHQRAIMAKTTVQCLLIPRYWLLEKPQNPGNMWQRIKFHLNATIPSREALFKDFLATLKWNEYKKSIIKMSTDNIRISNPTKIQDIPIICRIIEGVD